MVSTEQVGSTELDQEFVLNFTFETSEPLPSYVTMVITLPKNIQMDQSTTMKLNGELVNPTKNIKDNVLILEGLSRSDMTLFKVEFPTGLKNPLEGPYSYKYPQVEF